MTNSRSESPRKTDGTAIDPVTVGEPNALELLELPNVEAGRQEAPLGAKGLVMLSLLRFSS